ncbi:GDPmannose 4,6-dehydratase [Fibrella aestuarina BUZ 2]|uniref:GDP-mannose 4,6-dehydratase n=1 Tax=Fibrella aestuarina BUZ 2 TaxID=1166018 RepID=I0KFQ8_9BACT|nr:GDP-mannose 4,6-dehydratase [Fibrella aestuarina]CCH02961.1 GDPmannose 4,6-dehydratase [Fibrella aestuarina BUZ 2]
MKTALICGISGQDGAYLAKLLLEKGYQVYGGSRDAQMSSFRNLERLGIREAIQVVSVSINDFRSVLQTLQKVQPDEVYNLAGQSSVGLSFEQPVETLESISIGTLNLLESIRFTNRPIRFYNAGSSECFGDTGTLAADEHTPFRPRSPYGVAKAAAFWQVANYREAYQLHASTGILFNHESPLRPERFVTQKIVSAACRIANGSNEKLTLGNVDIARDWGWAPDYVEAMWRMLQQEQADDFVIATGQTHTLKEFIAVVFEQVGLKYEEHVVSDSQLFRPTDIAEGHANPAKAKQLLGWQARHSMETVAKMMVDAALIRSRPQLA